MRHWIHCYAAHYKETYSASFIELEETVIKRFVVILKIPFKSLYIIKKLDAFNFT